MGQTHSDARLQVLSFSCGLDPSLHNEGNVNSLLEYNATLHTRTPDTKIRCTILSAFLEVSCSPTHTNVMHTIRYSGT